MNRREPKGNTLRIGWGSKWPARSVESVEDLVGGGGEAAGGGGFGLPEKRKREEEEGSGSGGFGRHT